MLSIQLSKQYKYL